MKTTLYLVLLISLAAVSACSKPAQTAAWQTMSLKQDKPVLVEVTDGDPEREHGERMFFEAKLTDESGKAVAQLLGMHVIVDIPGEDGIGDATQEERLTSMSIVFADGDEIAIVGYNTYPQNQSLMKADEAQVRAITGGTGKYKGIRGQIKTTRNADETYTHTLEYRLD